MDLRFAVRLFARQPAFALTAIVTLALGIGANTAIFTAVDGILLRPLPYQDSPRLTMLWMRYSMMDVAFRPSVYLPLAERTNSFDPMAAFQYESFNLTGDPNPERIQGITATAGIFPLLGVAPEIGRSFAASEERDRVAILSHELWQRRFAGDSGILGRAISLNGSPYTVIGVLPRGFDMVAGGDMPRGFRFAAHTDVWVPLPLDRASGRLYLFALGKLRPGVTLAAAQAELTALTQSIRGDQSQEPDLDARAIPLQQQVTGRIRPTLSYFVGAVAVVLLIVCANVANLLIARAPLRQREIAVRAAMGAGAGRILRQLMTESLLLGAAGGALGCLSGWWGAALLRRFAPEDVPRFYARLDLRVAAFFVAISALASLLFGVLPAVRLARIDLHTALKTGGRIVGGRSRLGSTLAIAELALSLVLLSGAGLLVRSFARLLDTDPGFRADRVLTAQLALPEARYPHIREMSGLIDRAVENISRAPGIEAAGAASVIPMGGIDRDFPELQIEGRAPFRQDEIGVIGNSWTSGDFFRVLRIPLVGGRYFDAGDRTDSPRVAILNEGLSRRIFGHADPVGRNLIFSFLPDKPRVRIVGVVGDVKQAGLDLEAPRRLYLPASQVPIPSVTFLLRPMTLVVRTAGDPTLAAGAVRAAVRAADPDQPVSNFRTMQSLVEESLAGRRFVMTLLGLFAGLAVVLAGGGLYGVIAYTVSARTGEIGVRMALGARPVDVLRMILREGLSLAAAGVAIGTAGSLAASRLIAAQLYGVSATDAVTFTAVAALLAGVAVLASIIPARRAARVDPMAALRQE